MLPWALFGISLAVIFYFAVRLHLLHRELEQMMRQTEDILAQDTNNLIFVSSQDRYARRLALELNRQLRTLRRQRQKYLQGDRELKDAVTNISHDLRTPLTAICGYLELMECEDKTEAVDRYLSRICGCVDTLRQLTEELFRYSVIASVDEPAYETVLLNRALEEALLDGYGALCARGITPQITMTEQPVYRCLDASALQRIFDNLLSNILKYSDGDLEVTLDGEGKITFANSAKGLTATELARLFDRFYTVETGRASTGLGLSIARLLTERMGGVITAEYAKERLRICVCFPQRGADIGNSAASDAEQDP